MKSKTVRITIIVCIVILLWIAFRYFETRSEGNIQLLLQNQSTEAIEDVRIFCNDTELLRISQIEAGKKMRVHLSFPERFTEGVVILRYSAKGETQEYTLSSYAEWYTVIRENWVYK